MGNSNYRRRWRLKWRPSAARRTVARGVCYKSLNVACEACQVGWYLGSLNRFVHLSLNSFVHAFHVDNIVHADRVIDAVRRITTHRTPKEDLGQSIKNTKTHGSYIDFGCISDQFRVPNLKNLSIRSGSGPRVAKT